MGRPTDGPVAREQQISVRMTASTKQMIDKNKGALSRSEYIRRLAMRDERERREQK